MSEQLSFYRFLLPSITNICCFWYNVFVCISGGRFFTFSPDKQFEIDTVQESTHH